MDLEVLMSEADVWGIAQKPNEWAGDEFHECHLVFSSTGGGWLWKGLIAAWAVQDPSLGIFTQLPHMKQLLSSAQDGATGNIPSPYIN